MKKSKKIFKNTCRQIKMETQIQNLWDMVKSNSKMDIYNDTSLP